MHSAGPPPKPSSDRAFGLVMTTFLALVGLYPLLGAGQPRAWALAVAAAFLVPALVFPKVLAPLNKLWTKFGLLMAAVVGPVALAVMFFGVITPYGWLMRRLGKGQIPVRFDKDAATYWIQRDPPGPAPKSLRDQF
jgi:hypothetical protein